MYIGLITVFNVFDQSLEPVELVFNFSADLLICSFLAHLSSAQDEL